MLYIMRHGKTEWNDRKKLQGQTDIPLNEDGILMARKASEEYKDINFDICYSSPLIRAKQTAELVLEGRDIPIVFDERLKEMKFGEYEGIENSFSIPDCPINVLFKNPENYIPPSDNCESFKALFKRTGEFLEDRVYPLLEEGKDVLIVGHGAMNLSIICQVNDIPLERFWETPIVNCKLLKLI